MDHLGLRIFLFRQFSMAVPDEYVHAARLDGMSERASYGDHHAARLPAITAFTVPPLVAHWNDLFWPMIVGQRRTSSTRRSASLYFRDQESGGLRRVDGRHRHHHRPARHCLRPGPALVHPVGCPSRLASRRRSLHRPWRVTHEEVPLVRGRGGHRRGRPGAGLGKNRRHGRVLRTGSLAAAA